MKTLATPIMIVNGISAISEVCVVGWLDYSHLAIPYGQIICQVVGGGGKHYPSRNHLFTVTVSDSGQCMTIQVNPDPSGMTDQVVMGNTFVAGTPYTTAAQLYDSTVGDRSAKLLALENQMIAMGLWPSMFASS